MLGGKCIAFNVSARDVSARGFSCGLGSATTGRAELPAPSRQVLTLPDIGRRSEVQLSMPVRNSCPQGSDLVEGPRRALLPLVLLRCGQTIGSPKPKRRMKCVSPKPQDYHHVKPGSVSKKSKSLRRYQRRKPDHRHLGNADHPRMPRHADFSNSESLQRRTKAN